MIHKAVIGTGLSVCVAACASSPVTPAHSAASRAPAGCVAQTATRIPLRPSDCGAAGANEPGQALYLLDPTLPVPSVFGKPRMASR
jgi:hypothetical protein